MSKMEFPKTLIKDGMRLTVNNTRGYDAAIESGFKDDTLNDEGHKRLIGYLETLLEVAKSGAFHDFATTTGSPKVNLRNQLLELAQKVVDGDFDN